MYTEIGSFDAKTRLPEILRAVEKGQRYTITLRGKPIADLVPSESAKRSDVAAAVEAMKNIRKVKGVSTEMLKEWISEGRH